MTPEPTWTDEFRWAGPSSWGRHGEKAPPVVLYASDAGEGQPSVRSEGIMFSLLGTAEPKVMRSWFARLAQEGRVVNDLQRRPWGAWDGQVVDRFGLHWLLGFEEPES